MGANKWLHVKLNYVLLFFSSSKCFRPYVQFHNLMGQKGEGG